MGLFSFTQEIAIDLGTANTIIICNDKIVVDEPSVVALDRRTDRLIAIGEKARQMQGKGKRRDSYCQTITRRSNCRFLRSRTYDKRHDKNDSNEESSLFRQASKW